MNLIKLFKLVFKVPIGDVSTSFSVVFLVQQNLSFIHSVAHVVGFARSLRLPYFR